MTTVRPIRVGDLVRYQGVRLVVDEVIEQDDGPPLLYLWSWRDQSADAARADQVELIVEDA